MLDTQVSSFQNDVIGIFVLTLHVLIEVGSSLVILGYLTQWFFCSHVVVSFYYVTLPSGVTVVGVFLLELQWWVHSFWSYSGGYIPSGVVVAGIFSVWSYSGGYIPSGVTVAVIFLLELRQWMYSPSGLMVDGIFLNKVARVF